MSLIAYHPQQIPDNVTIAKYTPPLHALLQA